MIVVMLGQYRLVVETEVKVPLRQNNRLESRLIRRTLNRVKLAKNYLECQNRFINTLTGISTELVKIRASDTTGFKTKKSIFVVLSNVRYNISFFTFRS